MLVYYLPMISGEKCLVLFFMQGALLLFQNKEPSIEDLDVDYNFFDEHIWPTLANRIPAFESLKVSVSAQQAARLYFSVSALCVCLAGSRTFFCLGTLCLPGRQQNFFLSWHTMSAWQAVELFLSWHSMSSWQAAGLYFSVLALYVCPAGSGTLFFCLGTLCPPSRQRDFICLSWLCMSAQQAVGLYFSVSALCVCLAGSGAFFSVAALNCWALQGKAFVSAAKYEHSPFFLEAMLKLFSDYFH